MFNSAIVDVVIGMIFVYLLLSLMCSAANELIELWLKNRATDLERGLRELLNDPTGTGLVQKVYNHPLISGLFEGAYNPEKQGKLRRALGRVKLPSYIPAQTFALAILDIVIPSTTPGTAGSSPPSSPPASPPASASLGSSKKALADLRSNISTLNNKDVERALLALIDAAESEVTALGSGLVRARENVEQWFDASMDRVSGWYKRRAHIFILIIAFFVTIGVNADSVLIAKRLSADQSLRDSLVSAAQDYARVNANSGAAAQTQSQTGSSEAQPQGEGDAKPGASPTASPNQSPRSPQAGTSPRTSASSSPSSPSPGSSPASSPVTPAAPAQTSDNECKTPQCKFKTSLDDLKGLSLPIGWDSGVEGRQWPGLRVWERVFWAGWYGQFRIHIFGWLLTALAISLGAPFWFDLLNKFIVVRSSVKPKEKSPEEKPK